MSFELAFMQRFAKTDMMFISVCLNKCILYQLICILIYIIVFYCSADMLIYEFLCFINII